MPGDAAGGSASFPSRSKLSDTGVAPPPPRSRRGSKDESSAPTYRMIQDPGAAVCEVPVLWGLKQRHTVEAVKLSTVLLLQKADFVMLIKAPPPPIPPVPAPVPIHT